MSNTSYRVSHLSDQRQFATSLNIVRAKTDALDLSADQLTVTVDRNSDIAGTIRATSATAPTTGSGLEVLHNGLATTSGIGSLLSYDRSNSAWQTLNIGGSSIALQVGGVTTATVDNASVDLSTGMVLKINGVQVVGAPQTGWVADTGTALKTANATYVPGTSLTYSATYVQTEQTATGTRIGLIETALQNATEELKALKDLALAHGLAGA